MASEDDRDKTKGAGTREKVLLRVLILVLVLIPLILFSYVSWGARAGEFRIHSDVNLKFLRLSVEMYANDNGGRFPRLPNRPGAIGLDMRTMYPDYISGTHALLSPGDPKRADAVKHDYPTEFCFENSSYYYLGYCVWNDETVAYFAEAYRQRLSEGLDFDEDLAVPLPVNKLPMLKKLTAGEMESIPGSGSFKIPIFIEKPQPYPGFRGLFLSNFLSVSFSKPVMGGAVIYADGTSEFITYPGKWPMTEKTITVLEDLRKMRDAEGQHW